MRILGEEKAVWLLGLLWLENQFMLFVEEEVIGWSL